LFALEALGGPKRRYPAPDQATPDSLSVAQ
jgi:hypothetical protein